LAVAIVAISRAFVHFFERIKNTMIDKQQTEIIALIRIVTPGAIIVLGLCATPGFAATISRSLEIDFTLSAIWWLMAQLDALRDRLSPFRTSAHDGLAGGIAA
jgi:hypothetical protein